MPADLWSILTRAQRRHVLAMQAVSVVVACATVTGMAAIAEDGRVSRSGGAQPLRRIIGGP
jgi:hypothetical protein